LNSTSEHLDNTLNKFEKLEFDWIKPLILKTDSNYILNLVTVSTHNPKVIYSINSEYANIIPYQRIGIYPISEEGLMEILNIIVTLFENNKVYKSEQDSNSILDYQYLKNVRLTKLQLIDITEEKNLELTTNVANLINKLHQIELDALFNKEYKKHHILKIINSILIELGKLGTTNGVFNKFKYQDSLIMALLNYQIYFENNKFYIWL